MYLGGIFFSIVDIIISWDACEDFVDANIFCSLLRKVPDVENFLDSLMVAVEKCGKEQRVLIH